MAPAKLAWAMATFPLCNASSTAPAPSCRRTRLSAFLLAAMASVHLTACASDSPTDAMTQTPPENQTDSSVLVDASGGQMTAMDGAPSAGESGVSSPEGGAASDARTSDAPVDASSSEVSTVPLVPEIDGA